MLALFSETFKNTFELVIEIISILINQAHYNKREAGGGKSGQAAVMVTQLSRIISRAGPENSNSISI